MTTTAKNRTEARSNLSTVIAALGAAGFKANLASRNPAKCRPGFRARYMAESGVKRGVWLFGEACAAGEFALVCAALESKGFELIDAKGERNFVQYGCARVLNT